MHWLRLNFYCDQSTCLRGCTIYLLAFVTFNTIRLTWFLPNKCNQTPVSIFRQNKTNINKYPKTQGPIKKNNQDEWTVINSMDKERAHTWNR